MRERKKERATERERKKERQTEREKERETDRERVGGRTICDILTLQQTFI